MTSTRFYTVRTIAFGALAALAVLAGLTLADHSASAALPGLNGRLACEGERGTAAGGTAPGFPEHVTPRNEIYTMRPDGSDLRLLTSNDVADIDPAYSPDGGRIAFASARAGSAVVIHTMNADGTNVRRLLFTGAQSHSPSWSPDGANLAFMDGSRGLFDVTRVNVNTGALTPLTSTFAIDGLPAWSPDGTKIAFDHSGTPPPFPSLQIYVMGAIAGEAAGKTQLTSADPADPGDNSFGANWSPDGTRITFQTDRDENNEIYTMRSDGTDLRRLTSNATNVPGTAINESDDSEPAYSPDGKAIVFQSARTGDYEVYTMDAASGASVRRLTNSPGFDGRCDWQPVRAAAPPPIYPQPAAPFADCPVLTANVIRGTAANNSIVGTPRGDRIFAGTGNDTVDALAGDDCVDLGPGTDRGQGGDGRDLILGGLGSDRMAGNLGNDRLRGGAAADRLIGGFGDDNLHGQSGSDRVNGERGRDRINGGSGGDVISAGSSGDRVAGDQGGDRINGNSGNDSIRGNSGNDRLAGSSGRDRLSGGSGSDRISARDRRRDRIACGRGRDRVVADRVDRVARDCERVRRR